MTNQPLWTVHPESASMGDIGEMYAVLDEHYRVKEADDGDHLEVYEG